MKGWWAMICKTKNENTGVKEMITLMWIYFFCEQYITVKNTNYHVHVFGKNTWVNDSIIIYHWIWK